jgi:hypothetical protein
MHLLRIKTLVRVYISGFRNMFLVVFTHISYNVRVSAILVTEILFEILMMVEGNCNCQLNILVMFIALSSCLIREDVI